MGISDLIGEVLPNWTDYLQELVTIGAEFLVAGVLVAFLFWSIGYAIMVAFRWLNSWTSI